MRSFEEIWISTGADAPPGPAEEEKVRREKEAMANKMREMEKRMEEMQTKKRGGCCGGGCCGGDGCVLS